MLHTAVLAAFQYQEDELPIPAIVYGIIGAVAFIFLGAVAWAYKDVSRRHYPSGDPQANQHMTSTGSESHGAGHPGHH